MIRFANEIYQSGQIPAFAGMTVGTAGMTMEAVGALL
jgi:hypothetical protein